MTIKKTLLSLILCICVASANAGNLYSYDKYLTYHYIQVLKIVLKPLTENKL